MNTNDSTRPKLDPKLGEEVRVRLLKDKPYVGSNNFGAYFLYTVLDLGEHVEKALFLPENLHAIIEEKGMQTGSEFILKKVPHQNGKKVGSRLELSMIGTETHEANSYKEIMLECLHDALTISKDPQLKDLPFRTEDVRSIALTIFIARTKV